MLDCYDFIRVNGQKIYLPCDEENEIDYFYDDYLFDLDDFDLDEELDLEYHEFYRNAVQD